MASCFPTPVRDGAVEPTIENRSPQPVHILLDGKRDLGWVGACTEYTYGIGAAPPFPHTMRIEARDGQGRTVYDETVDIDPTKGIARVTVRIPETATDECSIIKVSKWPTPPSGNR